MYVLPFVTSFFIYLMTPNHTGQKIFYEFDVLEHGEDSNLATILTYCNIYEEYDLILWLTSTSLTLVHIL